MEVDSIINLESKYLMPTYKRIPVVFSKAKGMKVWDTKGKEYLDFFAGIAVNTLGHAHPSVIAAIESQIKKFIHGSNHYYLEPQMKLAEALNQVSFGGKVFFTNSGAEANETAIKLARKYAKQKLGVDRHEIITMRDSFHGRTLATLTATGQEKYRKGFEPLVPGFKCIPFNNIEAVKESISTKTCAILIEPIQGEGGVNVASSDYLQGLRELCDYYKILLIFDEIQTGLGRTGKMFAYEHYGLTPDIMTLAKPLGGGLPLGATIAREEIASAFQPGDHGTTFGGNPVACSAGLAVLKTIISEKLVENSRKMGEYLLKKLNDLKGKYGSIKEVRGKGLMVGMELSFLGQDAVLKCLEKGLLINCTMDRVLRFLPPLIVTRKEVDRAVKILEEVFRDLEKAQESGKEEAEKEGGSWGKRI